MAGDLYGLLFRKFIYSFYEKTFAGRSTPDYVREYLDNCELSQESLKQLQIKKLKNLLLYANENCAYYRETWKKIGFDPRGFEQLTDLQCLPVLDKATIAENYDGFVSMLHSGSNIRKTTGGSSGEPFHFELDHESNERRQGVMWRDYGHLGAGLGVKTLYVWGAHIAPVGKKTKIKDYLYNRFYNRKVLNSFKMSEANVEQFIIAHNRYRARALVGYVNPLVSMAQYVLKHGLRVHAPESILTGAEPLFEFQREIIEKAFRAPVYNTYGCREFMLIAAECKERAGLHVNTDHLLVELLDDNRQPVECSEPGDVVVTDLHNYGFPLIRYQNGDRASWKLGQNCKCGSVFPLLSKIEGRKLDMLKTPDGRMLPGEFFPHLLKDFSAIEQFQIVQDSIDEVKLYLVLKPSGKNSNDIKVASKLIKDALGERVTLHLKVVDEIPLTASGKQRVTISRLGGS